MAVMNKEQNEFYTDQVEATIQLKEGPNGELRMLAVFSNNFEDRSGEIIPEASHRAYAKWVNESGFQPMITMYHQPQMPAGFWTKLFIEYKDNVELLNEVVGAVYSEFGLARVERVMVVDGFPIFDCKVNEDKIEMVKRLAEEEDLAMSHGFVLFNRDGNILNDYITFEGSILKRHRADNIFTMPLVINKEAMMANLTPEDKEYLEDHYGEGMDEKIETSVGALSGVLKRLGVNFKSADETGETDSDDEVTEKDTSDVVAEDDATPAEQDEVKTTADEQKKDDAEVSKELDVDELAKAISDKLGLPELSKVLEASFEDIRAEMESLKADVENTKQLAEDAKESASEANKSLDEKVAEQFENAGPVWKGYSASQASDNVLDKKESKEKSKDGPQGIDDEPSTPDDSFARALSKAAFGSNG